MLFERVYLQLQPQTHECLAVNAYLKQISNPQAAFAVHQKHPVNLDEGVTATLEMESYVVDHARVRELRGVWLVYKRKH